MADNWEFECPQFVDFRVLGESSPKVSTYAYWLNSKSVARQLKVQNSEGKDQPSLFNFNHSTPVAKELGPFSKFNNLTDSYKIGTKKVLSKRLSKSDGFLHVKDSGATSKKKPVAPMQRKKSMSEGDVRGKRNVRLGTPMCLKRTLSKTKDRKFKTSEELELEKIAELRKQTRAHVRSNQLFLRKLKQKKSKSDPVPMPVPKVLAAEPVEVKKPTNLFGRDRNEVMAHINAYIQKPKPQLMKEKSVLPKSLNIQNEQPGTSHNLASRGVIGKPSNLAGPSGTLATGTKPNATKKAPPFKKYEAHSGLLFKTVPDKRYAFKPLINSGKSFVSSFKDESSRKQLKSEKEPSDFNLAPYSNVMNKENIVGSLQRLKLAQKTYNLPLKPLSLKVDKQQGAWTKY